MGDYKRIISLALILASATAVVLSATFWLLYNTAFEEQRLRLVNMAQSSVHMIKAVANFDKEHSADYPEGAAAATISQIKEAQESFRGFGNSGEFVIAHRHDDQIHFILRHRFHSPEEHREIIPLDSVVGKPIQRALSGLSGTVVVSDYRGVSVLAAYEPVPFFNLGVVTKMDIAEIRAPFVRAGGIVLSLALLLIIIGTTLFFRLGEPLIHALRTSRERYRAIVHDHPEMLCRFSPDGTFTFVNDSFCRFFGKPREELIGQTFTPLVIQDDLEEVEEKIETLSKDDPVSIIKNRVIAADGEIRWTRWANQAILDDEGRIIEYQSGGHDITEQVQAEENLRKSEEKFRGIFDESVATIYLFDNEKNFINTNQAGLDLLGYSKEELLSMCISDVDANPTAVLPAHEQLLSGGRLINFVHQLERKDGRIISVLNNSKPLADSHGDVVGMESTLIDITERIRAQEELSHSEARLSHLLTSCPVVIYTSKASDYYAATYISPNVKELMGFAPEDFVSDPDFWANNVHPDDLARVFADVEALFEHGEFTHDYRFCKPDGTYMWVRDEMNLIYGDDGEPMEIVGSWSDITERIRAEEELKEHHDHLEELVMQRTAEMKEKANQLEQALEREKEYNVLQQKFVSLVSHEFRTPLSIIDGAAQRLIRRQAKLEPGEVVVRAKKVRSAVTRMIGLIDTTLYASRLDAGKIDVKIAPCDIKRLVSKICERQSEISPSHQIETSLEELPGEIFADHSLLDQIFTNLLSNAIKYSPGSPLIEVRGWSDRDNALITITDQGLGIPADDLPHMFGRFFRAKTAEGIKGTGIGLNVVKEFVQLHGGSVGVDSLEGEGSTFTVRLPISVKG